MRNIEAICISTYYVHLSMNCYVKMFSCHGGNNNKNYFLAKKLKKLKI